MSLSNDAERSIGITLGGFLVAVASICLSIMASQDDGGATIKNEIFGLLGLASLLTSALMVDSILDKAGCNYDYRLKTLLNGGYALFCLIMSGLSAGIIFLYHDQEGKVAYSTWVLILISSIAIFYKLMLDDKEHYLAPILISSYVAVFISAWI